LSVPGKLRDFGDNTQSEDEDQSMLRSSVEQERLIRDFTRALRLIVRLGQLFDVFLLAKLHSREYKRIASDCAIMAQVRDVTFIDKR